MQNEKMVKEWANFSKIDLLTAKHLFKTMYPKPLEIICYHCQQSAEKIIKARYPQEIFLKETHAQNALEDAEKIFNWCTNQLG